MSNQVNKTLLNGWVICDSKFLSLKTKFKNVLKGVSKYLLDYTIPPNFHLSTDVQLDMYYGRKQCNSLKEANAYSSLFQA